MAQQRTDFQALLETLCPTVYFQPPTKLTYPCIIYKRDSAHVDHADNAVYNHKQRYEVTAISSDPDNDIQKALAKLPLSTFNRFFTAEGLNHDVYTIFF